MDELYDGFIEKTDYLIETKGLLKDRINSLGGSITSGTTFRDYLVWLDSLYEALDEKTITGLPDSLEGKCEQTGTPTPSSPIPINITTGEQVVSVIGKNLFDNTNINNIYSSRASISTINSGVRITSTSTGTGNYFIVIPLFDVSNNVGETYTIKCNFTTTGNARGRVILGLCDENGGNRQAGASYISTSGQSLTYTIPTITNATYLAVWFYVSTSVSVSSGDYVDYTNVMLEKGNQATTYEEYKGNDYEINLGKNLVNALDTSSMINFTKTDDVFKTSALTSTGYGGIASMTFTNSTPIMKNGVGYFSADIRLVSGTTSSINVIGDKALTRTNAGWVSNHTLSNEFQRYCYKYDISMGTSFTGFMIQLYNCNNAVLEVKNIMFSYSSDLDYSPYKTPIYLGKIGTYQDYIVKTSGKNLCDYQALNLVTNGNGTTSMVNGYYNVIIDTENISDLYVSGDFTLLNSSTLRVGGYSVYPSTSATGTRYSLTSNSSFNTGSHKYIMFSFLPNSGYTIDNIKNSFMINEGTTALPYEPYGEGQWYIHKEIGRYVYNNDLTNNSITADKVEMLTPALDIVANTRPLTNIAICNMMGSTLSNYTGLDGTNGSKKIRVSMSTSYVSSYNEFKALASNNNLTIYYVLNTPTNTLIEDEELINQLNEIEIFTVISEDFYN